MSACGSSVIGKNLVFYGNWKKADGRMALSKDRRVGGATSWNVSQTGWLYIWVALGSLVDLAKWLLTLLVILKCAAIWC